MKELSVIVPVHNMAGEGKLDYCMQSLVNQTLESIEIIAVDDASEDNSLDILKEYEKKYPDKVKVIASPENRRQGGARNLGLKVAQGKFIGFMDSDDWAAEDMYESMLEVARRTGADAVGCDLCRVKEHTMIPTEREVCNEMNQTGIMDHDKKKAYILKPGPVVTKIYARSVFYEPEFLFPENMSYEDNASFVELGMRIRHYEHVPEAKYFYYQREGSTTHTISMEKCENRMESMRIMLQYAEKNGSLKEFRDEIEYVFTTLFYRNTLFSYMQGSGSKNLKFIKALGKEAVHFFPEFRDNSYYIKQVDREEKKLIDLQLHSTLLFVCCYQLKQFYRRLRYVRAGERS